MPRQHPEFSGGTDSNRRRNRIRHLARADIVRLRFAGLVNVTGAMASRDGVSDDGLNASAAAARPKL